MALLPHFHSLYIQLFSYPYLSSLVPYRIMSALPLRALLLLRPGDRLKSGEPSHGRLVQTDHYIGIDVGTSSARACVIDTNGDIVGISSDVIGLWQPEHGFYV
jgi:hypothetical protein